MLLNVVILLWFYRGKYPLHA